jgi:PAS domain-containing protein
MQEEMVKEIGQEFSDTIEILTVVGVFESAISPGKLLHQKGVEVIVAWGVTASVLEENLSIPVVEVRVPEMDILQAVKQAHKISNQIGLVTPRPVNKLPLMEELYGVKIKQILFKNKNDVLRGIAEAVTAGCEVIVGRSHITLDTTNQFDTKSLLIGFNPMAMREAFQEAIRLARLRQRERQEYKRLETIFNSMTEGFAVIDNQAKII